MKLVFLFKKNSLTYTNSHDLRIDNFDAPPIIDANIENVIPRTQSWADTTASSPPDPAIVVCIMSSSASLVGERDELQTTLDSSK